MLSAGLIVFVQGDNFYLVLVQHKLIILFIFRGLHI